MNDEVTKKHGGKRVGAGRKSGFGQHSEETTVIRVPVSQKPLIVDFIAAYADRKRLGQSDTNEATTQPFIATPISLNPSLTRIPIFEGKVNAGQSRFASAAQDYEMKDLDLNEFLVTDPPATFIVQLDRDADSMIDAGILPGSWVIVNKALAPKAKSKDIVLAIVNGEYMIKRLYKRGSIVRLLSENKAKAYPPIEFSDGQELVIWGVVQHGINSFS
ncbi:MULTISPECIES: LexA family transcriptional regulator [unclassified Methylophilus]|uniref:LexA family protein n=1 Tax=unclassified Methylophilus TaxID=2630143 RepID=UPI00037EBD4E|nr:MULTISPECIES: S24 family peptidase [unclassified Methylophilus]